MSEAFDWLKAQGLIARDATQRSDNWVVRTAKGHRVAAASNGLQLLEVDRLLAIELHPALAARQVREKFARGEVDEAVWAAVKQVEVSVRDAAGAEKGQIGTKLMSSAFKPGEGPLHDPELDPAEQAGVLALYQGLIGAFKNPSSHHRRSSALRDDVQPKRRTPDRSRRAAPPGQAASAHNQRTGS